ncbi:MAG TPA: hypothetical protein VEH76_00305 [Methylocystis sp.]|nr:hypothetical protein [Methylocystis sp.]
MQNRQEIGTLVKVAGALGILMLLTTMAEAFLTYHSREISLSQEWGERHFARSAP